MCKCLQLEASCLKSPVIRFAFVNFETSDQAKKALALCAMTTCLCACSLLWKQPALRGFYFGCVPLILPQAVDMYHQKDFRSQALLAGPGISTKVRKHKQQGMGQN